MVNVTELGLNESEIVSELLGSLTPTIMAKLAPFITILKGVGIAILAYIVYLIIRWIYNYRHRRRLKDVAKMVHEIDRKLDILLARQGRKTKPKKPEKKKSRKK